MVSGRTTRDSHGHHQRWHRRRRRGCAAADRGGTYPGALARPRAVALGVLPDRRARPALDGLVVAVLSRAGESTWWRRLPAGEFRNARARCPCHPRHFTGAIAGASRDVGRGRREVFERRRLVFL